MGSRLRPESTTTAPQRDTYFVVPTPAGWAVRLRGALAEIGPFASALAALEWCHANVDDRTSYRVLVAG